MLVSFIIVAYNAEKVINDCLNSLNKQTYQHNNIEVILVDSNSEDKTKVLMNEFKRNFDKDYNRIVVIDNPKKTLPCGWNVALKQAKGDVILRVDAHTIYPKDFIEKNINEINKGEDIVGGQCISITKRDSQWEKVLLAAEESIFGCGIADFRRKKERKYVDTLAFAMYRKKIFDEVGYYNENLARTEDNEMHYRMRKAGYKFLLSPEIVTYRYARSTLKDMIKQKYGNGKWIGITMSYCPKCFSIYHLVPILFVLAIIFSAIMAMFQMPIFIISLFTVYTVFNIINLILVIVKNRFCISYLMLPVILFTLHCAYGIGTMVGIAKIMKNRKKTNNE